MCIEREALGVDPASGVELDLEVLRAARVLAERGHW